MAVIIQELVVQNKIMDDSVSANDAVIEDLIKQIQSLKIQVKKLKEKVESKQNENER